ncbi:bifunctional diguanylate cyclase/phosphodiesterase [Marilutibacter penaei]|uniref:bifunctional diguanylate cyclase/phosphodiesterase n=1 Tax=Marilutibacter penaei TaxID=2759900 RepID=UPI0031B650D0
MPIGRPPSWRSGAWLPSLAVLLLCLAPVLWLSKMQQARAVDAQEQAFGKLVERTQAAMLAQLRTCGLLVRSVQTLFIASEEVSPQEFEFIYSNLKPRAHLPSLQALAFAEHQPGLYGSRYPTRLVAPLEGNEALLELDISRQPANRRAAELSRDTDEAVMSAPFRLVQFDQPGQAAEGVTLRLPIFSPGAPPAGIEERRRRFVGSLAVSFQVQSLIDWALPADIREGLHVAVTDVTGARPAPLYDSHPQLGWTHAGERVREVEVNYGSRIWRMRIAPLHPPPAISAWQDTVLLPGALISLLLALLAGSLAGTRRRALELGWKMSHQYRESEERFRRLNELLPALVLLAEARGGRIRYANQAARNQLGADVTGMSLPDLFEDDGLRAQLLEPGTGGCENVEAVLCTPGQRPFWASVSISPVELDGHAMLLMVASDTTEQRELTDMLSYQASHDMLTELYNRREFERRLDRARASRAAGGPVNALLYIDLDQFKLINDTSGHIAGDQLLAQLALVMREQLRGEDVLARLGGDEFGVLLSDVGGREGAREVAERIRRKIDGYVFVWEETSYAVSASIGVVMIEHPDASLDDLLAHADTACYLAKESGRNRIHFYSAHDDDATRRQSEMEWANRLRWAVDEHRLMLKYQEIQPLAAASQDGPRIELLLRFRDENGRPVVPGAFIPAAERYGLMPMIDRWVIETAIAHFDELHPAGTGVRMVTLNLSGASIEEEALGDRILGLLRTHRVDPRRVCFEITETAAVRNLSRVARLIEQLRAEGCSFALDDFGAGMSSFGYLKNLPVDFIKIDGSFIRDMLEDPMSEAIVRAVADIGHRRGLRVVAEWVDSSEVVAALVKLGVDYGQGFVLHEPEQVVFQRGDA